MICFDIGIPGRPASTATIDRPIEQTIHCTWCEKCIQLSAPAFPTHFAVRGLENAAPGILAIRVEGIDRILSVLVPPKRTALRSDAIEVVAVCCSAGCQKQLALNWSRLERRAIARN
jgi:hypothetical protein